MNRQEANREILERLTRIIEQNPDLRFSQALYAIGCVIDGQDRKSWANEFYVEPTEVLKRIKKNFK